MPAKISVSVVQTSGESAEPHVVIRFEPIEGVKINRYPKLKIHIPEQDGIVRRSDAFLGDDMPPPAEQAGVANYFKEIPTVELPLPVSPDLAAGPHEFIGKTGFFYCMPASNFCAPYRGAFTIPFTAQ